MKDEAVEDGIGERGVAEQVVPFLERELTGDQGRTGCVAVLEDCRASRDDGRHLSLREAEVVEDEEVELGERGQQLGIGCVATGDGDVVQESWEAQVQRGESVAARLYWASAQASQDLPTPHGPVIEDVEVLAQPAPASEGEDEGLVESAGVAEVVRPRCRR